jgi:hypothetical protein
MRRCQITRRCYYSTETVCHNRKLEVRAPVHASTMKRERRAYLGPVVRLAVPGPLLAIAFSRQCRFYTLLLARFQIEGVPLDVFNNVFLEHFAFEALQRAFQAFAFVNLNLSQVIIPISK